ncbi:XRE family transcriptional regulator [Candidatus Woesearchaeota archaeon]|nr:MAG: XRE family transcriptional regulator [Candidatus Woesearchaeota archaeon]
MELQQFLVKAKKATYAAHAKENKLADGCKELTYEEAEWKYRDRYFGANPFSGQEVVWKNNKLVWTMNYYGKITSNAEKEVAAFLRKAMKQVTETRPFRGPSNFKEGDFEYVDASIGTAEQFSGTEKIFLKKKEMYRLLYHGGSMNR